MKKMLGSLMAGLLMLCFGGIAQATVIDFDDLGSLLTEGTYWGPTPTGFVSDGFLFDFALMNNDYNQTTYSNTYDFPSLEIAAYSNNDSNNPFDIVTVSRDNPFNFIGAMIGGNTYKDTTAWYAASELEITGLLDGNIVGSVTVNPTIGGFSWLDANIMNVDTLVFAADAVDYNYINLGLSNTGSGSYWLMDDFTYTDAVPEPATMFLFGLGILGLAGVNRKKRQK
ncbi:hypothetical protein DO021_22350 [Desulfobacter hydrogenophilus]|uniref:PEP-CTERM sorting domain-containing protein n=1 Tax=Desulfobacter hydrogenophilus TaxID=2291 RepID=A0A328F6I6_9BACT|nr:PEP-CTERM sorting domain-containing protein [Desulfobacter hydrogenophilus]NDY74625.1 PEP-CTERM sorting domain-containing protein [Desulfobacter hydrogenophilus]QBH14470.1 PEP-CTERM sorting domain-containing protein [Desulfobacter hydrogenophilus]RAL99835.1 hypothetical protein DO021_22350 [Desulfobacter hydrogenophilus]